MTTNSLLPLNRLPSRNKPIASSWLLMDKFGNWKLLKWRKLSKSLQKRVVSLNSPKRIRQAFWLNPLNLMSPSTAMKSHSKELSSLNHNSNEWKQLLSETTWHLLLVVLLITQLWLPNTFSRNLKLLKKFHIMIQLSYYKETLLQRKLLSLSVNQEKLRILLTLLRTAEK